MYALLFLIFALLASGGITSIDKSVYEDFVSNEKTRLVLFTASGCAACDITIKTLEQIQLDAKDVVIGQVNCVEEPVLCDDNLIFAVPTLMFSVGDSKLVKFRDRLDSVSISAFLRRQSGPAVTEIKELRDDTFQNTTYITVVGLIGAGDTTSRTTFETIATNLRVHYAFSISTDASVAISEGLSQPSIIVYKPYDDKKSIYTQSFSQEAIEKFLERATKPLIEDMNPVLYDDLIEAGNPVAFILTNSLDEKYDLSEQFYKLANQTKDDIVFVMVNTNDYPTRGELLGLGERSMRGLAIEDVRTTRVYPWQGDTISPNIVYPFIQKYLSGSLEPVIRSDPTPKQSPQSSSLITLVGSNFEDFVMDKSRDVLVAFSVPWCDYCSELHKVMEGLGQKYFELNLSDKVVLAKIDVHTNDVPLRITGYPTLCLFRAGDNHPVFFDGTFFKLLSEEQLASFVTNSGGNKVPLPGPRADSTSVKDEL